MEVCELHLTTMATMERIEKKLDNQDVERHQLAEDVAKVQKTIDNGLRAEIGDIHINLLELGRKFDLTISGVRGDIRAIETITDKITEFNWFREFATEFRNKLFVNTLKLIFMGGMLLIVMHFGSSILTKFIK